MTSGSTDYTGSAARALVGVFIFSAIIFNANAIAAFIERVAQ